MIRRLFFPAFLALALGLNAQNNSETPAIADSISYETTVTVSLKSGDKVVPIRSYSVTTPYDGPDSLAFNLMFDDPDNASVKTVNYAESRKKACQTVTDTLLAKDKPKLYFAWGGDFGASIDMSGNDMSSIDFDLTFGIHRGWIKFLGVGAQANIYVSNSCRSFPFYLLLRTNFREKDSRVFWEIKGGASLNFLEHNHQQTGVYGSTGIGVKLASGRRFSSHLVLAYTYLQRRKVVGTEMTHEFKDLHFATLRLGIVF